MPLLGTIAPGALADASGAPQVVVAPPNAQAPHNSAERPGDSTPLVAPAPAARLVLSASDEGPHFGNVYYEANNPAMRGPLDDSRLPVADGEDIAARWLRFARQVGGVFVLRDSLFSQQDHPVKHPARALMMPPNWVTGAVSAARRGVAFMPVKVLPVQDDAAWARVATPEALFGDFAPSEFLHREACRPLANATPAQKRRTMNARAAVLSLAQQSALMLDALPEGPLAVAEVGADLIARSDTRYFGAELRRSRVIPIFVHNPTSTEVLEGKGMRVMDNPHISEDDVELATTAIYSRRLLDGDMALERYDISQPDERAKAIEILTRILPRDGPPGEGGFVWLWVTGPLEPGSKLRGENASAYIEAFKQQVAAAAIDTTRVRYLSKPRLELPPGKSRRGAFAMAVEQTNALDLWQSIDMNSTMFAHMLSSWNRD